MFLLSMETVAHDLTLAFDTLGRSCYALKWLARYSLI